MKLPGLLFLFLLCTPVYGKKIALVIGNSAYPNGKLVNTTNDSRMMAEALRGLNFEVIHRDNLRTVVDFMNASYELTDLIKEDDIVMLFYAGHGIQYKEQNYLIPLDADIQREDDILVKAFNINFIYERLSEHQQRANIIILDACRNNPLERSFGRGASRGLAPARPPINTLVAYSTEPNATASDGNGSNSPFTTHLLKHIATPNLSVLSMFTRVKAGVFRETDTAQIPQEYTTLTKEIYLNYQGNGEPGPGPIPEPEVSRSFSSHRKAIMDLIGKKPVPYRNASVTPNFFFIEDDCSLVAEKTYSFPEYEYSCKTVGNMKNIKLNFIADPVSKVFYPMLQGVKTSCTDKLHKWNFYTENSWTVQAPEEITRKLHEHLKEIKLLCR